MEGSDTPMLDWCRLKETEGLAGLAARLASSKEERKAARDRMMKGSGFDERCSLLDSKTGLLRAGSRDWLAGGDPDQAYTPLDSRCVLGP